MSFHTPAHKSLPKSGQDWSLLEATQESLREHMAEIRSLRAALSQPDSRGPSSVSPKSQAEFVRALQGRRGDLDAWLECNNEAECREHISAYASAALAQPSGEPVAIALHTGTKQDIKWLAKAVEHGTKLYPAPQARQPLTDGQIARCMLMVDDPLLWGRMGDQCCVALKHFARAIEAAHSITARDSTK